MLQLEPTKEIIPNILPLAHGAHPGLALASSMLLKPLVAIPVEERVHPGLAPATSLLLELHVVVPVEELVLPGLVPASSTHGTVNPLTNQCSESVKSLANKEQVPLTF